MKRLLVTYWPYFLITLAVMLPLLRPGFILTLDMVFGPNLRMPDASTNTYPFYAVLHTLQLILPSDIIQKCLLLTILPLAAVGMHRLFEHIRPSQGERQWGVYIAGILFAVNPFTYSRFMAGQYLVLLGYALLPWFIRLLLRFVRRPGRTAALKLAGLAILVGAVSIHTLGLLAIATLCLLCVSFWPRRTHSEPSTAASRKNLLRWGGLAIGLFVVASSYWLVPMALGKSSETATIEQFDSAHSQAFATEGSNVLYKIGNVLRLQGFWAERHGLYALPQDQLPGWGTVRLLVWLLVGLGAAALWRTSRAIAGALFAAGIIGLLLSIGLGQPLLTAIGYREPHKFAGLVALVFALCAGCGMDWLVQATGKWRSAAAATALVAVLLFTPTMYLGFAGQLTPRHYPKDWALLNQRLNRDTSNFNVLFLPWHQYMSFGFSERIIANPAQQFFDKPVLISNDPELDNIQPPTNDPRITVINQALANAPKRHHLSRDLNTQHVRYVILAKEYDYRKYHYLDDQPELVPIWETANLKLYRNDAAERRAL